MTTIDQHITNIWNELESIIEKDPEVAYDLINNMHLPAHLDRELDKKLLATRYGKVIVMAGYPDTYLTMWAGKNGEIHWTTLGNMSEKEFNIMKDQAYNTLVQMTYKKQYGVHNLTDYDFRQDELDQVAHETNLEILQS